MDYNFDKAFTRLFEIVGAKNQTQLASAIGIAQPNISRAKRTKKIPEVWLLRLESKYNIDSKWVLYGDEGCSGEANMVLDEGVSTATAEVPKLQEVPVQGDNS